VISSGVTARGGLCLAVVAVAAALSPSAFGAPSKHRKTPKGRRVAPAAAVPRAEAEPRAPVEETSVADSASSRVAESAAASAAEDDAPARQDPSGRPSASTASDDRSSGPAEESPPSARRERRAARSLDSGAERGAGDEGSTGAMAAGAVERALPNDDDARALGRREAARVAAGRIEVAVSASIDAGRRVFTYSDPVGASPQPYRMPLAPLATFGLEAYPLASTDIPVVRDLGFRARVSRGFAMESSTGDGVPLRDSWTRFGGDLRQRLLLPALRGLELGLAVGVDASYFDLQTKADVGSLVPAARMLSLRAGLDGRFALTRRLAVLAGGGYLATLTRGQIYDRFRSPHVAGVDGQIAAAFGLATGVEARLEGRYTRYYASFAPEVGDLAVAGGALDEQMQLGLGLRYAH